MLVTQTALFLQVLHMPSDSKARNIMETLKEKRAELWNKVNVRGSEEQEKELKTIPRPLCGHRERYWPSLIFKTVPTDVYNWASINFCSTRSVSEEEQSKKYLEKGRKYQLFGVFLHKSFQFLTENRNLDLFTAFKYYY